MNDEPHRELETAALVTTADLTEWVDTLTKIPPVARAVPFENTAHVDLKISVMIMTTN